MLLVKHFKAVKEIKIMGSDKDLQIFIAAFEGELERRSLIKIDGHSQESSNSYVCSDQDAPGVDSEGFGHLFSPHFFNNDLDGDLL